MVSPVKTAVDAEDPPAGEATMDEVLAFFDDPPPPITLTLCLTLLMVKMHQKVFLHPCS
jgi:hypothetical protein